MVSGIRINQAPLPFNEEGKYTGDIKVEIFTSKDCGSLYIRAIGSRLTLETFTEPYREEFKSRFGPAIVKDIPETEQLHAVFGDQETVKNYGSGKAKTKEEVAQGIKRDSSRPFEGNPFTGFMIWDKESERIIGRISSGTCYQAGDSQTGLLIHAEERGTKKGFEACLLIAGIMAALWQKQFPVGDFEKKPVERFTATTKDDNEEMIKMITSLGMEYLRPLTDKENYSQDPRSLYGIKAGEIGPLLLSRLENPLQYKVEHFPAFEINTVQ